MTIILIRATAVMELVRSRVRYTLVPYDPLAVVCVYLNELGAMSCCCASTVPYSNPNPTMVTLTLTLTNAWYG